MVARLDVVGFRNWTICRERRSRGLRHGRAISLTRPLYILSCVRCSRRNHGESPFGSLAGDPDRFLRASYRGSTPKSPSGRSGIEQPLFHKSDVLTLHSLGLSGPPATQSWQRAAPPFARSRSPEARDTPPHTVRSAARRPPRWL